MGEVEEFAASIFERFAPVVVGREVGPRRWRNGEDDSGIRVDWTYEASDPAAALEVTALHGPGEPQIVSELNKKLEPELGELAEEEGLGQWLVVVEVGTNIKRLIPELRGLLRRGAAIHVGEYTSEELTAGDGAAITELHRSLKRLGLVEVKRCTTTTHGVDWMVTGGGPEIVGLADHLEEAIVANRQKLQLDGYEAHLAVVVLDFQLSRFGERTPVPELGHGIDYLWVIHSWQGPQGRPEVWTASAGSDEWACRPWN